MFGIGWTEILVILVVALLVLGPGKLPDIAKGLGKGIRDFRKAMSSLDDDAEPPRPAAWSQPAPPPPPAPLLPPASPVEPPAAAGDPRAQAPAPGAPAGDAADGDGSEPPVERTDGRRGTA